MAATKLLSVNGLLANSLITWLTQVYSHIFLFLGLLRLTSVVKKFEKQNLRFKACTFGIFNLL